MNSDIRVAVSFKGNRKRKKLKMILGDQAATDYLLDLWITVATDKPDGNLAGLDNLDIALMAGWEGDPDDFVKALVDVGFLDSSGDGYLIHEWAEHNGYAAASRNRSEAARKAAKAKWDKRLGKTGADNSLCGSNAVAEEKQCGSNAPSPSPSPSPIPSPARLAGKKKNIKKKKNSVFDPMKSKPDWIEKRDWGDLLLHREKKKAANTERAISSLVAQLKIAISRGFTVKECVDEATNRDWTGFKAEWMKREQRQEKGLSGLSAAGRKTARNAREWLEEREDGKASTE